MKPNNIHRLQGLLTGIALLAVTTVKAQLSVTAGQSATALAQNLAGSGVTILNASLTCATQANGTFTAASSNLGISDGILLTTGSAVAVAGSEPGLTSSNNNTNGDPALQALSGASTTRDACILQFDLVPKGDTVKFDYVFGSEEYINSVCGPYNDAFAFFISGPGITGSDNMARVPGTNIPVAVNSINNGVPGQYGSLPNCTAMGPGAPFTAYYNNNLNGTTVAYRGLTTVLTAKHAVTPCDTYHLKLTIADAVNGLYDSGVFIKAGSLQSASFDMSLAGTLMVGGTPSIYRGCNPAVVTFSRSIAPPVPQTLNYVISGTAVNGVDYAPIASSITIPASAVTAVLNINGLIVPPAGPKSLKLVLYSPYTCSGQTEAVDSVMLNILDAPHAQVLTTDTTICSGSSIQLSVEGSNDLYYIWTPPAGLNNIQAKEPVATPAVNTTYQMKAYIAGSGCDTFSGAVTISLISAPAFADAGNDITVCEHTPVSLMPNVQPDDPAFQYAWTGPMGFASADKELNLADPLTAQSGYYHFTVLAEGCGAKSDSVLVSVVEFPADPLVSSPLRLCLNEKVKNIPVTGKDLKWYRNPVGGAYMQAPDISTEAVGTFDYYVTQNFGNCESERVKFTVIVERCCDDYVFIPSAFTPNQDGQNDFFDVIVRNGSKVTLMQVYNRWGQLVYQRRDGAGWNGTFNGTPVELGNYFYNIEVTCKDGTLIHKKGEVLVVK